MSAPQRPPDPRRRRFLKRVGLAGLASLSAPALALPASDSAAPKRGVRPKPMPAAPPAAEKPPEISEDARALAAILKRRYGQHLTGEQLEAVTKEIQGRLDGGKALRAARLANGDEPDATFRA
ncbi:MAG TPA: hypothetical protein VGK89_08540 [Candidatus Eisenbacteria bacterium]|jgi:hypothetical protein